MGARARREALIRLEMVRLFLSEGGILHVLGETEREFVVREEGGRQVYTPSRCITRVFTMWLMRPDRRVYARSIREATHDDLLKFQHLPRLDADPLHGVAGRAVDFTEQAEQYAPHCMGLATPELVEKMRALRLVLETCAP